MSDGGPCWVRFRYKIHGINTDTKAYAYVLKDGETDAPEGLKQGLRNGNRVQDIFTEEWRAGQTGDEIARRAARKRLVKICVREFTAIQLATFSNDTTGVVYTLPAKFFFPERHSIRKAGIPVLRIRTMFEAGRITL